MVFIKKHQKNSSKQLFNINRKTLAHLTLDASSLFIDGAKVDSGHFEKQLLELKSKLLKLKELL